MPDGPDYTLLDRDGLSAQLFFPRPDPSPTPQGASDHDLDVGGDVTIAGRRYVVDQAAPTIVYFHGNGEVIGDHDGLAPLYHSIGVNLFVFEFRGYGRSTGTPTIQHLADDGWTCGEWALECLDHDGFTGPCLVMGRSMGANPALEIAANVPGYRGLILESGAGSVDRYLRRFGLGPNDETERLVAAHAAKLGRITAPTLLIHGRADDLVPLAVAEATASQLTGSEVHTEYIEGAGHNDLLYVDAQRYMSAIAALVDRVSD